MKHSLLLVLVSLLTIATQAQISIDSSDIGHVGDKVYFGTDTLVTGVSVSAGSSVAQTWDFSGLVQDDLDSVEFVNPASTPSGAIFPSADIALSQDGGFAYLNKSNVALNLIGLEVEIQGVVLPISSDPSQTLLDFPSTYGSSINQTVIVDTTAEDIFVGIFDSIRLKRIITTSFEIDAFGSLTTPDSIYSDVLRQASSTTNNDSIWTYSALTGTWNLFLNGTTSEFQYQFFTNDAKIHVLELEVDALGGNVVSAQYQLGSKPVATAIITNASCFGENDGFVDQEVLGGTPPYTYRWSNGGTSQDMGGLTVGTYTVTIYDQLDSSIYQYNISEPAELVASGIVQDETFGTDGAVNITVTGGTPAYAFSWSNGSTSEDLTGVNADSYTVTVTDDNGCTTVEGFTVGNNTSTFDLAEKLYVSIYPNPVSDKLILSFGKRVSISSIRILTILGNELLTVSVGNEFEQYSLPVQELPNGGYILEVSGSNGKSTQRFLKN